MEIWGRSCNFVITGREVKRHLEVKRKHEFQDRFQQKQEEHPRTFSPRHLGRRRALLGRRGLRADTPDEHHHNDIIERPDERGVPIQPFGFQRPMPQHGLLRGERHRACGYDCQVFCIGSCERQTKSRLSLRPSFSQGLSVAGRHELEVSPDAGSGQVTWSLGHIIFRSFIPTFSTWWASSASMYFWKDFCPSFS